LLLCVSFFAIVESQPQQSALISSYGSISTINTPTPANFLAGAWASDPAWAVYGKYTGQYHIDKMLEEGATFLMICVTKVVWDNNPTVNNPYIPNAMSYHDYIAWLVKAFQDGGGSAGISLHLWHDSYYVCEHGVELGPETSWWSVAKTHVIYEHQQEWIDFGVDIISHLKSYGVTPWGILIMDEPARDIAGLTKAEYRAFAINSINQYRAVEPSINIVLYSGGGPGGNHDLSDFINNPLPYSGIFYTITMFYDTHSEYTTPYTNGDLAGGKTALWSIMDSLFGTLKEKLIVTPAVHDTSNMNGNWPHYLEDLYEYCRLYTAGYAEWAAAYSKRWNIWENNNSELGVDWLEWSDIGQVWAANL